jgi:chromosome segregation ATPase
MTDNQFEQIFGLLTKAVNTLTEHDENFERIDENFKRIDENFERMDERFGRMEKIQNDMRTDLNDFREETRSNFEKVSKDIRGQERKISYLANQFLEIKAENKDLRERVEALEERNAA